MIPFGNETVTLLRRVEETDESGKTRVRYARSLLTGCSWRSGLRRVRFDTEIQLLPEITCRVPADQAVPAAGDCLFLGDVPLEIAGSRDLQAALDAASGGTACRIAAVRDCARPGMPMPHYLCTGA